MSDILRLNQTILRRNGQIARNNNKKCCCGSAGCCCPLLNENPPNQPHPTLTISSTCAALDGKTAELIPIILDGDCVIAWNTGIVISLGSCPSVEIKIGFVLECLGDQNGCEDFVLSWGVDSSACADQSGGNRVPVDPGCSCDPVNMIFSNLKTPCKRQYQTECDCCLCSDTMTITITL